MLIIGEESQLGSRVEGVTNCRVSPLTEGLRPVDNDALFALYYLQADQRELECLQIVLNYRNVGTEVQ